MEEKKFSKNDQEFVCEVCGRKVSKLGYSSRDHCPFCLSSKHVDVNPGDRANECLGILVPFDVALDSKKGYVIEYRCSRCGKTHKNRSASDDSFQTILSLMNKSYEKRLKFLKGDENV